MTVNSPISKRARRTRPTISLSRAVWVAREMFDLRRIHYGDDQYFVMPEVWEMLAGEDGKVKVVTFKSRETEDYVRKASVIAIGDCCRLVVDGQLLANAKWGCLLSNFTLSHELSHYALGHLSRSRSYKHFQLFAAAGGVSNIPPTAEEYEANFAAICFQCGANLFDPNLSPLILARKAFSDPYWVEKVQRLLQSEAFLCEWNRPQPVRERVVL